MELQELNLNQTISVQVIWDEHNIEFSSQVLGRADKGIYITPYLHNGQPLDLNITMNGGINCHIFGNSPEDNTRISWRNVELTTTVLNERTVYLITTAIFNKNAKNNERRAHERIKIRRNGTIMDLQKNKTDIMIYDISDNGISFYAPATFAPRSKKVYVTFSDHVNNAAFNLRVECTVVHYSIKVGTIFYGCSIAEANRDYLLYGCMRRLLANKPAEMAVTDDVKDESQTEEVEFNYEEPSNP